MSWNVPKSDRVQFQQAHNVNLMAVDGTWRRACKLKDISSTGASLDVEGSTDVLTSREFFLLLSSTGLAFRRCELAWINGESVGVRFVFAKKKRTRAIQG
jgi:hypothetical protein